MVWAIPINWEMFLFIYFAVQFKVKYCVRSYLFCKYFGLAHFLNNCSSLGHAFQFKPGGLEDFKSGSILFFILGFFSKIGFVLILHGKGLVCAIKMNKCHQFD